MRHKAGFYEKYVKRLLDIVLAGCALIVLSPLLLVTAILVRVKLGSPVIFCQERPGKDEKIFKLHKFRSMTDARDENGNLVLDEAGHSCTMNYESVMGWGIVSEITDPAEKLHALDCIMKQYHAGDFPYNPAVAERTRILCLKIQERTGKRRGSP